MPLFAVRWENGDISFVSASSKDDAVIMLDEIGDANGLPIFAVPDFMIHLRLIPRGEHDDAEYPPLDFNGFGERCVGRIMANAYPEISAVELDQKDSEEKIRDAADRERTNVKQNVKKEHPMYAHLMKQAKRK